jgi:hypothetical protein
MNIPRPLPENKVSMRFLEFPPLEELRLLTEQRVFVDDSNRDIIVGKWELDETG